LRSAGGRSDSKASLVSSLGRRPTRPTRNETGVCCLVAVARSRRISSALGHAEVPVAGVTRGRGQILTRQSQRKGEHLGISLWGRIGPMLRQQTKREREAARPGVSRFRLVEPTGPIRERAWLWPDGGGIRFALRSRVAPCPPFATESTHANGGTWPRSLSSETARVETPPFASLQTIASRSRTLPGVGWRPASLSGTGCSRLAADGSARGQVGQDRNGRAPVRGSDGPPSRKPGQHPERSSFCSSCSRDPAGEGSPHELSITSRMTEVPHALYRG